MIDALMLMLPLSGQAVVQDDRRLHVHIVGSSETPLPGGLAPTALLESGTGSLTVEDAPGDLVRSASKYLRSLAVIPVDPEDDALVDEIVSKHVHENAKKRVLKRR